jgi:hypothetical protein
MLGRMPLCMKSFCIDFFFSLTSKIRRSFETLMQTSSGETPAKATVI